MRRVQLARIWLIFLGLLLILPAAGPAAARPGPDPFQLTYVEAAWVTDRINGWSTSVSLLDTPTFLVRPDLDHLTVAFNRAVDLASLRQALALSDGAGQAVPITDVELALANGYVGEYQYAVTLPGPLAGHTRYTLTVGSSVRDDVGATLTAVVPVPFTTGDTPPPPAAHATVFAPGLARGRTLTSSPAL